MYYYCIQSFTHLQPLFQTLLIQFVYLYSVLIYSFIGNFNFSFFIVPQSNTTCSYYTQYTIVIFLLYCFNWLAYVDFDHLQTEKDTRSALMDINPGKPLPISYLKTSKRKQIQISNFVVFRCSRSCLITIHTLFEMFPVVS